jgi:hypothetical protein
MRTLSNTIAIAALTLSALQIVDQRYWPAGVLAIASGMAYLSRHFLPMPGQDGR